jgi:hypothetical protein
MPSTQSHESGITLSWHTVNYSCVFSLIWSISCEGEHKKRSDHVSFLHWVRCCYCAFSKWSGNLNIPLSWLCLWFTTVFVHILSLDWDVYFSLPIKLMIPIPDQHSGYFPKFNPIYPTKPISSNISPLRPFIDNLGPSPLPSGPHWPLLTLFLNVLNMSDFSWCLLHLAFHRTSFVFIFLCSSDYILFVFLFSVALSTTFYSY